MNSQFFYHTALVTHIIGLTLMAGTTFISYLISKHFWKEFALDKAKGTQVGGVVPVLSDGLLLKIIGRISKLNMAFANMALKDTGLNQIEEFGILGTIRQEGNPKKTEVIYANLFELSSGTDMLARLKKRGIIREYNDKEDKRSKRIELTAKGDKIWDVCKYRITKNAMMMMHDLSSDDKDLCIQLLQNIEIKYSAMWQKNKGKSFDEIYEEVISNDKK